MKVNPQVTQNLKKYLDDKGLKPQDLQDRGQLNAAMQAIRPPGGRKVSLREVTAARDALLEDAQAGNEARREVSADLLDAIKTADASVAFGGGSATRSTAYTRFGGEIKGASLRSDVAMLLRDDASREKFAAVLERVPWLQSPGVNTADLLANDKLFGALVDGVKAGKSDDQIMDTLRPIAEGVERSGSFGSDPIQQSLSMLALNVDQLYLPVANMVKTTEGRDAVFAFAEKVQAQGLDNIDHEARGEAGRSVIQATPFELKPGLVGRAEVGQYEAGQLLQNPDLIGALDDVAKLLEQDPPFARGAASVILAVLERGALDDDAFQKLGSTLTNAVARESLPDFIGKQAHQMAALKGMTLESTSRPLGERDQIPWAVDQISTTGPELNDAQALLQELAQTLRGAPASSFIEEMEKALAASEGKGQAFRDALETMSQQSGWWANDAAKALAN